MTAYMPQSKTDDWATPQSLFDELNAKYAFDEDVAASSTNHKCRQWFGLDHLDESRRNGLIGQWTGKSIWINPPYGRGIADWVAKADTYEHPVVMLLPARTDTKWFHDYALKHEVEFIKGRVKFGSSTFAAPFPSMIIKMRHAF